MSLYFANMQLRRVNRSTTYTPHIILFYATEVCCAKFKKTRISLLLNCITIQIYSVIYQITFTKLGYLTQF